MPVPCERILMSLLKHAIDAGIPLITCRTSDTINLEEVLKFYTSKTLMPWSPALTGKKDFPSAVYYGLPNDTPSILNKALYDSLVTNDAVLILVNPEGERPEAFNVGELVVPRELIIKHLKDVVPDNEAVELSRYMNGLTLKQMVEVVSMTQVMLGDLNARSVMSVRSAIMGNLQGLHQVTIGNQFYKPVASLVEWVKLNKAYFLQDYDDLLIPRGIIFHGPPGVGKTEGAKYIAKEWGVPLYRLDLSSSLGKYVGESESNLSRILHTVDTEEPCIMLIDEVEKLFKEGDDGGVTTRLLSQLLWWMQERRTRVLVVMTTNDISALPKELYRAGRIDTDLELLPLGVAQAKSLVDKILEQFQFSQYEDFHIVREAVSSRLDHEAVVTIAHADVVRMVYDEIKVQGVFTKKESSDEQ